MSSVLERHPSYEAVIGIEVHVQLNTKSKIFCSCPNQFGQQPNKNICPVCAGYPGVLPVLNKEVVNHALLLGLATNSNITRQTTFSRKHYFYPDLPKNFQITQDTHPICRDGFVIITGADGTSKKIRLIRIHMEEDAGKNIHSPETNESFVDLNRAGTPLLEIVSHPDMSCAEEARLYLKSLRNSVLYLGISTGNMEEGAFRADTNISVRKKGEQKLGTKVELKNINSFKFIADAIDYEIERQIGLLEHGQRVLQETRLWDTAEKKTISMRSKEEAADYRYFQEPDLPILDIDDAWIAAVRERLPELPEQRFERLIKECKLAAHQATILVDDQELAAYFDAAYAFYSSTQLINWVLRDVLGYLKEHNLLLSSFKVTPVYLAELVRLIDDEVINNSVAQEVFLQTAETGTAPAAIVKERGLEQIGSIAELEVLADQVISENAGQVAAYKAGNQRLFGFFVGQVMKLSGGKANPRMVNDLLRKKLSA